MIATSHFGRGLPAALVPTALGSAAAGLAMAIAIGMFAGIPAVCATDLPLTRWNHGDLTMLRGCWHRRTDMETRDIGSGAIRAVSSWAMCFNDAGGGRQTLSWADGDTCSSPIDAAFHGDGVLAIETQPCQGTGFTLLALSIVCRWRDATQADCPAYLAGGLKIPSWPGGFHPGTFQR